MFIQKTPQISTTREWINFLLLQHGNVQKIPKNRIWSFLPIFEPSNPLKSLLHYHWSTFKGYYSPKRLHKLVLSVEIVLISYFYSMRMSKLYPVCSKPDHFDHFSLPPNLLKSHLYYQWSTSNCLQSPKSLHQLVLPKNVFISHFYGMEMYKMW